MTENLTISIPAHLGIIIDGNRRWAKERNLPVAAGHKRGYELVKQSAEWFLDAGVKTVSYYVFSTENWQRAQEEVNFLMKLLEQALAGDLNEFTNKNIRLLISGRIGELPGDLPALAEKAMNTTANGTRGTVNLCVNYGGRAEIVDAFRSLMAKGVALEQVHAGMLKKYLYQPDLTDPDLIVRTSGEQRLSGFLTWQSCYSELLFLKKLWPEFERGDVDVVLEEYTQRKRRFGGS